MKEPLLAGSRKGTVTLVANGSFGMVDADYRDADWIPSAPLELNNLIAKIVGNAVNLFDHGLGQNLHFNTDFDRGYRTSA